MNLGIVKIIVKAKDLSSPVSQGVVYILAVLSVLLSPMQEFPNSPTRIPRARGKIPTGSGSMVCGTVGWGWGMVWYVCEYGRGEEGEGEEWGEEEEQNGERRKSRMGKRRRKGRGSEWADLWEEESNLMLLWKTQMKSGIQARIGLRWLSGKYKKDKKCRFPERWLCGDDYDQSFRRLILTFNGLFSHKIHVFWSSHLQPLSSASKSKVQSRCARMSRISR